jgi:hypothetical protein
MSQFEGTYPFSVTVFPVPESDLWGVSEREGATLIYHMKDRRAIVMNEARRLAHEHSIQVACTLEHFLDLTIESDATGVETWTTADGFEVRWDRAAYAGDRQGLDHLTVQKGDQELGDFFMDHDTDSDRVEELLALIAPGKQAAEISGHLSWP